MCTRVDDDDDDDDDKHIRKMKTIQSLNILVYNHAINVTLHALFE